MSLGFYLVPMVGLPFRPRRKNVHWTFFSSNWLAPAQPIFRTCSFSSPTVLVIKKILTFVRILFGADGGTPFQAASQKCPLDIFFFKLVGSRPTNFSNLLLFESHCSSYKKNPNFR